MPRAKRPAGRKDKKNEISWSKNPEWTETLVGILIDNERIRNGLFHDSKERKNTSGHSKEYWHMQLAEGIFEDMIDGWHDTNAESEELRKDYAASTGNYLGRLKAEYKERVRRLKETGGSRSSSQLSVRILTKFNILGGEDGDELSDEEREAEKKSAEDNLLARYRTEWPWWDDLHALWCERPNFNPPGVQNSTSQCSIPSCEPPIDLDPDSSQSSNISWSPTPPTSAQKQIAPRQLPIQTPVKRKKMDAIERLQSSVKEMSELETTKIKEEYAYKRFKLEMQDKDLERQLEEKKLRNQAMERGFEEKKLRFRTQMQLYQFRFQQWVDNKLPEEPSMPVFE